MKPMKKNKIKIILVTLIVSFYPSYSFANTNLEEGIKMYNQGDYKKAIELLNKAAQEEPDNPTPHQWLSKAYEATFDLQRSMEENEIFQKLKSKQLKNKKNNNLRKN
ncbi:MAG: hypothetical protein KatS3mg068_1630 [Candidatus Sericytochromatia bacterium]|nr:MAG: hypothetical protein KatS3mg068_1630 [Candidatus Sericytochromatia bacterium]